MTMEAVEHDITIVGGGPGGYVAALRAAQLGANVALVEKDKIGGTCLNRGCIPTKALIRSVEVFLEARHADQFGVEVAGDVRANFAKMMERKNKVVADLVAGIERLLRQGKVTIYRGQGRLVSARSLKVVEQEVNTKKLVIATGSVPARIPIPGLSLPGVVTSDELLEITEIPQSLVVIGGGVIGMEFASMFAALGTQVTVIEMLPQILPPVDEEIARRYSLLLRQSFPPGRITTLTEATVKEIRPVDGGLEVHYEQKGEAKQSTAQMVLVAVGRSPYTEGLGLGELGLAMNRRAVAVNDRLETNLDGVYAIGDVTAISMLAHVASYQGEIAVENALGRPPRSADYRFVPNCIFTLPEIAGAGLTERQAKDQGIAYKASRFPFSALGRSQAAGETQGLVKIICEEGSGLVIGMHIMGPHATDLIAEGMAVMQLGGTAQDIVHTIHAHPTFPEAIAEAAMAQFEGALHQARL